MLTKIVKKLGNATAIGIDKEDREIYGIAVGDIIDIEIKGVRKNGTKN